MSTTKKKYKIKVETIRSYKITMEAVSAGSALQAVEAMTIEDVDTQGDYIDTVMSIHEVECVEEN